MLKSTDIGKSSLSDLLAGNLRPGALAGAGASRCSTRATGRAAMGTMRDARVHVI
jgi:hypothetical protein